MATRIEHKNNVYEAFCDFLDEFKYEYAALAKDPPKDLDDAGKVAWTAQNKRKMFLGKFASRNLQKDYEEAVPAAQQDTITYDAMITLLKAHYDGAAIKPLRTMSLTSSFRGAKTALTTLSSQ